MWHLHIQLYIFIAITQFISGTESFLYDKYLISIKRFFIYVCRLLNRMRMFSTMSILSMHACFESCISLVNGCCNDSSFMFCQTCSWCCHKIVHLMSHDQHSEQEAQLPQRNSASATHDYLGWSADLLMIKLGDTMHRTQQNRRGCIIFWHSNVLIHEMLAENGFWHKNSPQGHSRSFTLQWATGRQRVAYRIACRISEVLEDMAS